MRPLTERRFWAAMLAMSAVSWLSDRALVLDVVASLFAAAAVYVGMGPRREA